MNQMVNQIMGNQPNPLKQAWEMAQSASNPQQALLTALANAKKGNEAMETLKRNNWNGEKAFYDFAKELGIDGNQLVQTLQSMGLK